MFKKYYKEANDDIKADEKLINSVIQNAKKRKPSVKNVYIRYGVTAAAAVAVVSAAVISMPVWQQTDDNKDGVIIEERQTSKPDSVKPDSTAAVSYPSPMPQKEENTAENTRENTVSNENSKNHHSSKNVFSDSIPSVISDKSDVSDIGDVSGDKAEESPDEAVSSPYFSAILPRKQDDTTDDMGGNDFSGFGAETAIAPDETSGLLGSASEMGAAGMASGQITADSAENTDTDDSSSVSYKKSVGGALKNSAIRVPQAEGFWITESADGMRVFENDSGGTITVTSEYVSDGDSNPVYTYGENEIYVTLTVDGVCYSVTASGTEKEKVIEFVNSILYY